MIGPARVARAALGDEWLEHLQSRVGIADARRRYSQRTVDMYRQRLHAHVLDRLGSRRFDELAVEEVRLLVERLTRRGLAPSSVSSCVNILSGLLRYALKRKVVAHNVVRDLDRDDRPGAARLTEPRYLTAAELDRLFAEMTDTFRPVAMACAYTGLRVSEALGLRWRDVDLDADTLDVTGQLGNAGERLATTKTQASAATVRVLPALRRELKAHRSRQAARNMALVGPDALVFTTTSGKPQSRRNALRAIHAAGDNGEGVERVGMHDLRHSLVAIALEQGLTAPEVALLARHANARVTMTVYAGLTRDGREQAAGKLTEGGFGALDPWPLWPHPMAVPVRSRRIAQTRNRPFAAITGPDRPRPDARPTFASWGTPVRAWHAPSSGTACSSGSAGMNEGLDRSEPSQSWPAGQISVRFGSR